MLKMPAAACAMIVTDETGKEHLIIGNKMLCFGEQMDHSLLNPNQLRHHGIKVSNDPTTALFGMSTEQPFMPFELKGSTAHWKLRAPAFKEVEDLDAPHLVVTSDDSWDLQTAVICQLQKRTHDDHDANMQFKMRHVNALERRPIEMTVEGNEKKEFVWNATSVVREEKNERHGDGSAKSLAEKLGIGLEMAWMTIKMTMQQGMHTAAHPVHKRCRVNHLHLYRRRSPGLQCANTLFSKVTSLSGNVCTQVIANGSFM